MSKCEFIETCPIFEKSKSGSIKDVFSIFCEGDYQSCARYQLKNSGGEVPITLLPNGEHMASLAE